MITIKDILNTKVRHKYDFYLPSKFHILESIIGLEMYQLDSMDNILKNKNWQINEVLQMEDCALSYHTFNDVPFMIDLENFDDDNNHNYFVFDIDVVNKLRDWLLTSLIKNQDQLTFNLDDDLESEINKAYYFKGDTVDMALKLKELNDDWR